MKNVEKGEAPRQKAGRKPLLSEEGQQRLTRFMIDERRAGKPPQNIQFKIAVLKEIKTDRRKGGKAPAKVKVSKSTLRRVAKKVGYEASQPVHG